MSELASLTTAWYDANARDLPWRAPDVGAWPVLISEFMLQQTPVVRVLPVWREWVARWPSPADLAAEDSGEAIRAWGRLGYPRRAMRLHACAVALVDRHGGQVPRRLDQMLALPGVGDYTARAVLAFAYGQRHPVVDTNVRRVAARAVTGAPDAGAATTPADLTLVESLLPATDQEAARASAAFMELGAVLCTARAPRCTACPVRTHCAWHRSGGVLPAGPSRKPQRYAGTDRQVRGLLLAVLRHAPGPVAKPALDVVWADAAQRERALASLLADGLVVPRGERFGLPGRSPADL
ncbi:A/G-specific adenine glycosylase [Catellatospora sp. NPDC049609]|uniref:A/G-specific adenine glycosylase n=1 Tax=Catellatospora sp. NPDC049609 TaxID=3155505 RepID=UPI00341B8463